MTDDPTQVDYSEEYDCPACHRARSIRWRIQETRDSNGEYQDWWYLECLHCGYCEEDTEHPVHQADD